MVALLAGTVGGPVFEAADGAVPDKVKAYQANNRSGGLAISCNSRQPASLIDGPISTSWLITTHN